jgi:hypothetical protein
MSEMASIDRPKMASMGRLEMASLGRLEMDSRYRQGKFDGYVSQGF